MLTLIKPYGKSLSSILLDMCRQHWSHSANFMFEANMDTTNVARSLVPHLNLGNHLQSWLLAQGMLHWHNFQRLESPMHAFYK